MRVASGNVGGVRPGPGGEVCGFHPLGFTERLISYEQVFRPSRVGKPSPSLTVSERVGPGEHPRPSQRSAAGDCWDCFFLESDMEEMRLQRYLSRALWVRLFILQAFITLFRTTKDGNCVLK